MRPYIKLVLLIILLLTLLACDGPSRFRFIVYQDTDSQLRLFINGKPVQEFGGNSSDDSRPLSYWGPRSWEEGTSANAEIREGTAVISSVQIEEGTYLVNLSRKHELGYKPLTYTVHEMNEKEVCPRCELGEKEHLNVGVYLMTKRLSIIVFPFNERPPHNVTEKRGELTEYFQLTARPINLSQE